MSIVRAFKNAHTRAKENNWDTIYVLLDIHGTVMVPTWKGISAEFYPHALDVLRHMSDDPIYKIIMWTCSTEEDRIYYRQLLQSHGIRIDYINENPEMASVLNWGDYTSKLYCSIGIDDKFGFSGEEDWILIKNYLQINH